MGATLAFCGVCCLHAVGALWWYSRWLDGELRYLQARNLAHWTFSEDDWQLARLLDNEWNRESAGTARTLGILCGGLLGFIIWLGWLSPSGALQSLATCAAVVIGGGISGSVMGALAGVGLGAWRELPSQPGELQISHELIWFCGRLYQLRRLGFSPVAAYFHPGSLSHLEFVYEQITDSGSAINRARVPIPKAAEDSSELSYILASFNR